MAKRRRRQGPATAFSPPDGLRDKRDRAILAVLIGFGLRRAELVGLKVEDFQIRVIADLIGKGKHNPASSVKRRSLAYSPVVLRLHVKQTPMDARVKTVREILHSGDQYLVPFFQRFYSWDQKHWNRLLDDLTALVDSSADGMHFLGPLVCTPAQHVPGEVTAYQLIDGQQRLTTLTLVLISLRDLCRENNLTDLADEIHEDFLVHKRRVDLQHYKIVPRVGDREALVAILQGKELAAFKDFRLLKGLRFFGRELRKYIGSDSQERLPALFRALTARMSLVVITVAGENPYEIFESLNSTGLPLEQSDLIRNYVFMEVPLAEQEDFFQEHWERYECVFEASDEFPGIDVTSFYRNYLMRTGGYSKKNETYIDFKKQNRERDLDSTAQVAELSRFARFQSWLDRPSTCKAQFPRRWLSDISLLDITTAHPLLLALLDRWEAKSLTQPTTLVVVLGTSRVSSFDDRSQVNQPGRMVAGSLMR